MGHHEAFIKAKRKKRVNESVFYFMHMGKRVVKLSEEDGFVGCAVPRTQEESIKQLEIAKGLLDEKQSSFVMFHINYLDEDDSNRPVSCILLLFWRATAGGGNTKSTVNTVKNSLTHNSYMEAESIGDLTWEIVKARC